MIIDELVLHDFGQYRGRVPIKLAPPSPEKPITLFGGLNGAGKTTLLDAIQLCLFGPLARSARREGGSYETYLLNLIHRGSGATSAAVELRFSHMSQGEEQHYHVKRSWRRTAKGCSEQLEVIRNYRYDAMATQYWAEQVEEFLPARIAHLFFFDGEQLEGYADPKSSAGLIETAVYNLLGLDLVDRLDGDLSVIERKRRIAARPPGTEKRAEELEAAKARAQEEVDSALLEQANVGAELGRIEAQLDEIEQSYRREGGHLYERRAELERNQREAEARVKSSERALQEAASGPAPLLLLGPLFDRLAAQVQREEQSRQASETDALLNERDEEIVKELGGFAGLELAAQLENHLRRDREERRAKIAPPVIEMSENGRERLRHVALQELPQIRSLLPELLASHESAVLELERAETELAAVPTADALSALAARRDEFRSKQAALSAAKEAQALALERLRRERDRLGDELGRFEQEEAEAQLADEDRARAIRHIGKVRATLDRFRDTVIGRHLGRIETLVLDSFRHLLRKESLVTGLEIDRESFQLRLSGRDAAPLNPEQLSAGERQLLATSVLWGLARASGRPLPTVIDTPLGRLDSTHRQRLIDHYFPFASHQVILLSTDEEIAGGYLEALQPYVGRAYRLNFDENEGATRVEEGYFVKEEEAYAA
jgi:DNA sulfur modification protein DndD